MAEDATARGKRVIELLADVRKRAGFHVEAEYPVVGGRIDLVWLWRGPKSFTSVLPLVGFEVESSWRTRKHLKATISTSSISSRPSVSSSS